LLDATGSSNDTAVSARDETAASVLLSADMLGNIRTQTLRAFTNVEIEKILATIP
jgi:uncharacterized protein with GYD domain